MAIARSLVDMIREQAEAHRFTQVTRVVLEIGVLGHVEPHAVRFCFDAVARGTVAEGAAVEVLELPARATCFDCGATVEITRRGDPCPACGGAKLLVQAGEELRLKQLAVV